MPWRPLPRIAFAVATYPFQATSPADLPLELGDELYIIEEGGLDESWFRGYLVAPPSLLAGLTCVEGQTLQARVFSGIFPRNCVEIREYLPDRGANGLSEPRELTNGHAEGKGEVSSSLTSPTYNGLYGRNENGYMKRKKSNATATRVIELPRSRSSRRPSLQQVAEAKSNELAQKTERDPSDARGSGLPLTPVSMSPQDPAAPRVRPPAPVPMLKIGDETPTSISEPLVDEIAACLREWHSTNLHDLLLSRRYTLIDHISRLVRRLDLSRRQLLHDVLTNKELIRVREKSVWDMVRGNKMLSNEIIVRDPNQHGRLLTGEDSAIEISKLQSAMGLLDQPLDPVPEQVNLHHLLVEFRGFTDHARQDTTLVLSLFSKSADESPKQLTESFEIEASPSDQLSRAITAGKLRTLFADLTPGDIGETSGPDTQLFLVIKVQANKLSRPATLLPSKTGTVKGSAPPRKETGIHETSNVETPKAGRRSIMWAQNKLGSTRQKPPATPRVGRSIGSDEFHPKIDEEARPSTSATSATSTSSNRKGPQVVRRDIGIAILQLREIFSQDRELEDALTVWTPSETSTEARETSRGWDELAKELISSSSGAFEKSSIVNRIRLRFHSFVSSNADSLIRKTPTLLHNISITPRIGFSGTPTKARSDIYVTFTNAHLPPQALFSHPERGTVQLGTSLDMHNIQLTLEVRKWSGERIERCIFPSSDSSGHTAWRTIAVNRGGAWNQTIKLCISSEDVPEAHLIMSVADAPGFPFALTWIPLWDQQAFISDGKHSPLLYMYDQVTSHTTQGRGAYLEYQWDSKARDYGPRIETLTGPLAALNMETYLCSTMFSQDQTLLGVLRWREQAEDHLLVMLRQFVFVPEIEIVKLLSDVFDALFGILVDRSGNDECEDLVFNALVTVLCIVHDRRFNLGPLVDEYLANRFNYPFSTPCLIRSYLRLLSTPADYQSSRYLRATFKVGRQIMKFIVAARKQQMAKEAGIGITTTQPNFNRDFGKIFTAFESLMREQSPTAIGSKTLIVQHMHTWLPELAQCFTQEQIMNIAIKFVDSSKEVKGKLILHKLVLVYNLSKAIRFSQSDMQEIINAKIQEWIAPYWGTTAEVTDQYREQVRLCSTIVSLYAKRDKACGQGYFTKIIQSYRCIQPVRLRKRQTFSMLYPTSYPFQTKPIAAGSSFDENLIELAGLLASFSTKSAAYFTKVPEMRLTEILCEALDTTMSILSKEAFPDSWLTLHVYHHRAFLQILDSIFEVMAHRFLPSPDDAADFNTDLWGKFFDTLLKLVRSDALALETFPEQKRRAVWKIGGDVREQGAELLRKSWNAIGWDSSAEDQSRYGLYRIGGFQVTYVPNLVGPIVELCMSVHEGLRVVAVEILQSMIVSEWTLNEDLAAVQAEMIDCLDRIFKSRGIGENAQQKLFITELLDLFEPVAQQPGDPLWVAIKSVVMIVDELLDLLLAVHSPDTTEAFRITHTLQLMDFLKGMHKDGIFIRYVHQLAELQAQSRNLAEAGLAMRIHAKLYDWDPTKTVSALLDPAFPQQSSFERKEAVYFEMIKYFEEGSAWDSALSCYHELAEQYEHRVFDFAKLARTQRSTATIYDTIARGESLTPRYFRVVYSGLGFPALLRDKQFIVQGNGSERLSTFTDRLQQEHPSAQIIISGSIENLEGQFLHVSAVNSYRNVNHLIYQRSKVAHSIREFLTTSQPRQFAVTSRRHSSGVGVKDQWVEKTIYTTEDTFPTVLRRSEIKSIEVVDLSPLETAIERTTRKTSELAILEKRIVEGDDSSFTALTEAIKVSVDASSTISIAQYRQLIPEAIDKKSDDDDDDGGGGFDEPKLQPLEHALKIALIDFAFVLKHALTLYNHPARKATQIDFARQFVVTFAPELTLLLLPPRPKSPVQMTPAWLPETMFSPSFSPTSVTPKASNFQTNGDHVDYAQATKDLDFAYRNQPTDPRNSTARNRLSLSFLKRNTSNAESHPSTNGTWVSTNPTEPLPLVEDRRSTTSSANHQSHVSQQESSESGTSSAVQYTSRGLGPRRTRNDSDPRPTTAQSAVTAKSGGGGLRKRLSAMGIGRKPSTSPMVARNRTLEEDREE